MATTLELPTDIWETIVKQSKQSAKDLLKDLSFDELNEVMCEATKQRRDKLRCVRNKYPKHTILNDTNNQKWVVIGGNNNERFVVCEKVYYTIDTTILGNYHKNNDTRSEYDIFWIIDLEKDQLVKSLSHYDKDTYIDFEVIQYHSDLEATRISRANNLKVGDTFSVFRYGVNMNPTHGAWDWRSKTLDTACVFKNTPKYIVYEEVLGTVEFGNTALREVKIKKVEKKRVVC